MKNVFYSSSYSLMELITKRTCKGRTTLKTLLAAVLKKRHIIVREEGQ